MTILDSFDESVISWLQLCVRVSSDKGVFPTDLFTF